MQKKGYIQILELVLSNDSRLQYHFVINILRDPQEIRSLEENWYSYGTLVYIIKAVMFLMARLDLEWQ